MPPASASGARAVPGAVRLRPLMATRMFSLICTAAPASNVNSLKTGSSRRAVGREARAERAR